MDLTDKYDIYQHAGVREYWIVHPHEGGYPADEAYFLHFIIHTIYLALAGHPELDQERLVSWTAQRHAQIERGELVYIAHQLDIFGKQST